MNPILILAVFGAVIGAVIGIVISLIRIRSAPPNDRRRWGPAVGGGILAYWVVFLGALFAGSTTFPPGQHSIAFNYVLGGIDMALAVYAACLLSTTVAPRQHWREMSYAAAILTLAWALYFNRNDTNYAGALLGTVAGAAAAFGTAYLRFGRMAAKA